MTDPAVPRVSVVVPTRDRPDRLAVCLAALERQTEADLEIVVVDDASRDAAAVAAVVLAAPRARLVRGAGRGPAAARNAGVRAARAAVVCFTDDDCEPVPAWAAALTARVAGAATPGPDAAAGPTRNGRPRSVVAAAAQAVATHLAEATIDAAGHMRFAPTSNLACRAEVCAAVPFDESYPLAAGEDRDWCARMLAWGYRLASEPRAVVVHRQNLDLPAFLRQQFGYGRGAYRFRRRHESFRSLEPASFYAGLIGDGFEHGVIPGLLVGVAQAATAVGFMREALARE